MLGNKPSDTSSDKEIDEIVRDARQYRRRIDPHFYGGNNIPREILERNFIRACKLIAYGTAGVWVGEIHIYNPRRWWEEGIYLHGVAMYIMYGAFIVASLNFVSVVVDHYDRRPNEHRYRTFAKWSERVAWGLFFLALLVHAFGWL